ncbi:nectin-2-like isoform X2 [Solea senegalensis]|uniref:Nectin-2-like isoform X2 n=1 Tax=Solea senegalensis TaxID=28829 RepID=A0AAV6R4U1_SOLSE|nr:nectin-2-like isoform X2 [Solea senegalensis]
MERPDEEERRQVTPGPSTGAVIGGILGALAFIGIIIGVIFYVRKRLEDDEGPPKHRPPPPVKAGSSTEMLNKPSAPATENVPLSSREVYYETTGPVTNLDDDISGALNGGAPPVLDDMVRYDDEFKDHDNEFDPSNHELPPAANIARGESFVSPAMYV